MSKRTEDLAFKYNINASVDELSMFVTEVYNDGYHAGKETQLAFNTKITLRDHFAGFAMQGLMNVYAQDYSRSVSDKELADWSYEQADAMLKAREVDDE